MAQQDPCWIDLQSLLKSSTLYKLLRTSSANTASVVSALQKQRGAAALYSSCLVRKAQTYLLNNKYKGKQVKFGDPLFARPSFTLQHCNFYTAL